MAEQEQVSNNAEAMVNEWNSAMDVVKVKLDIDNLPTENLLKFMTLDSNTAEKLEKVVDFHHIQEAAGKTIPVEDLESIRNLAKAFSVQESVAPDVTFAFVGRAISEGEIEGSDLKNILFQEFRTAFDEGDVAMLGGFAKKERDILPEDLQAVADMIERHGGILTEVPPTQEELQIINDFAENILSTYNNHAPKEEIVGFVCQAFDNAKGEMTMNELTEVTPEEFIYTFYNAQAPALVESTKEIQEADKNIVYQVGDFYLAVHDEGDYGLATLVDSNFSIVTQEIYSDITNISEIVEAFCEKYQFEGMERLQNGTAERFDTLEYYHMSDQARENKGKSYELETAFLENEENSFAVFQHKVTSDNYGVDLPKLEELGKEINKGDYHCVHSGLLDSIVEQEYMEETNSKEELMELFEGNFLSDTQHDEELMESCGDFGIGDVVALKIDGEVSYHFMTELNFREGKHFGLEEVDFAEIPVQITVKEQGNSQENEKDIEIVGTDEELNEIQNALHEELNPSELDMLNTTVNKALAYNSEHTREEYVDFVATALNVQLVLREDIPLLHPMELSQAIHYDEPKQLQGYVDFRKEQGEEIAPKMVLEQDSPIAFRCSDTLIASYEPTEDGNVTFQLLNQHLELQHQEIYQDCNLDKAIVKSCHEFEFDGFESVIMETAEVVDLVLMALEKNAPRQVKVNRRQAREGTLGCNDHYFITDSKVVGDTEVALGQSNDGNVFATWERCISADESKGIEDNWNFGHYFMNDEGNGKEKAQEDFEQRIDSNTPEHEKEKPKEKEAEKKEKQKENPEQTKTKKEKQVEQEKKQLKMPKLNKKKSHDER